MVLEGLITEQKLVTARIKYDGNRTHALCHCFGKAACLQLCIALHKPKLGL